MRIIQKFQQINQVEINDRASYHTRDRMGFFIFLISDLMHSSMPSWEKDFSIWSRAWKPKFDPILSRVLDALVPKIKAPDTKFSNASCSLAEMIDLSSDSWDFFVLFFWNHDFYFFLNNRKNCVMTDKMIFFVNITENCWKFSNFLTS